MARRARVPSARLKTDTAVNMAMAVAAADQAAREIKVAYAEWGPLDQDIQVMCTLVSRMFPMQDTEGSFRTIRVIGGHVMTWKGAVRAGAHGKLLFGFVPHMTTELEERNIVLAEVPHTELDAAFGRSFHSRLCMLLGVESLDELIEQAKQAVGPDDLATAAAHPGEPEVLADPAVSPTWGSWA